MFFDKKVPNIPDKYKRMRFVKAYDYLEKVSENESRYVSVSEMDMDIPKMGSDVVNFMIKSMCIK